MWTSIWKVLALLRDVGRSCLQSLQFITCPAHLLECSLVSHGPVVSVQNEYASATLTTLVPPPTPPFPQDTDIPGHTDCRRLGVTFNSTYTQGSYKTQLQTARSPPPLELAETAGPWCRNTRYLRAYQHTHVHSSPEH